ncbi:MAG TPA: alkaline phosphatase family protein [Acidimicrobiales bacterium]
MIAHGVRRLVAIGAIGLSAVLALATVTFAGTVGSTKQQRSLVMSTPCGPGVGTPHYRHVVWIVMENYGYSSIVGSADAPYLARLGTECGLATNYHAVTHPSLPNYLALTSGTTDGITDDAEPSSHHVRTANIFSELDGNWRALEESMPVACDKVTSGSYAARHDPAVYYADLATTCTKDDVPLREPLDLSAAFTFITPNICDDMHNCSVSTGDAWLAHIVPQILDSPEYLAHEMALFIIWDESNTGPGNHVATFVVAPSVPRGSRVTLDLDHYSLLRTAEQLLGLSYLGGARTAPSMVQLFRL